MSTLRVGATIGRYEIREEIGTSGAGVVYRARDPDLGRDIAIKIVAPEESRDREVVLTEARAMAKLSHPALMPIFDVGMTDDGVHLVMPLVTGGTLGEWLAGETRTWRAVVERFVAAGRGLAAAHAAGIVHGAFSASDVLLDRNGVLVAGFGLARPADADADARAEQADYCGAFDEALGSDAPAWLRNALARGRSPGVDARWPTLVTLLDHIDARRRRPRRIAIAAVATAAVAGLAAVAIVATTRGHREGACALPSARVAAVWTPTIRAQLERSILATNAPFAPDTVARIVPLIDEYVRAWRTMHVEACRSNQLLDRRMHCLDRRLDVLANRTRSLLDANSNVTRSAIGSIGSLPPIADCADEQALARVQDMPASPERRAAIVAMEKEIAELDALGMRVEPAEYLRRAHLMVARTRIQEYAPIHVAALRVLSDAQATTKQPQELTLRELAVTAARGGEDRLASLAWSNLVQALTLTQRFEEAKQLVPVATSAAARAGDDRTARYYLHIATSGLACETSDYESCKRDLRLARDEATSPRLRLTALHNLLSALTNSGDRAGAAPLIDEYLALAEEVSGTHHPAYADALYVQSFFLQSSGELDGLVRSGEILEQALAIHVGAFGENHRDVANVLIQIGQLAGTRGDLPAAEKAARRALAIGEALAMPAIQAQALRLVASVVADQGRKAEAWPLYDRALVTLRQLYGPDSLDVAAAAANYAFALQEAGDCVRARPAADEAIRIRDRHRDPSVMLPLLARGLCALETGAIDDGLADLARAEKACMPKDSCATGHLETVQGYRGMWLVKTGRDRKKGSELLHTVRASFERLEMKNDVAEIDAFMKQHGVR